MKRRAILAPLAGLVVALTVVAWAAAQGGPDLTNETVLPMLAGDSALKTATSPTPSPSATATPSPTRSPSPSPPGQPDCAAGVVCILRSSSYVSESGTLHVVGEVRNRRTAPVELVEITGNFLSTGGTVLGMSFTFAALGVIAAGGDSPFDLVLVNPPAGITSYNVQVTDFLTDASSPVVAGMEVKITNSFRAGDTLHLVGTLTNKSQQSWGSIQVLGALYSRTGTMLRTDFTFVEPGGLAPGSLATFDLTLTDPPGFTQQRFWVDADSAPAPAAIPLIIQNQSSYVTATGVIHAVGEVTNRAATAVSFVEVTANYLDGAGLLLMTETAYTSLSVIPAGGTAPFDVLLSTPPSGIVTISTLLTGAVVPSPRAPVSGLVATVTSATTSPNGTLRIIGTVRNDGTTEWTSVRPVVALYNAAGLVLFVGSAPSVPGTLANGQTGSFEIIVFNAPVFTRTQTWVEASPAP